MILTFETTEYFANYNVLREGFVASMCATVSRNYKAMKEAHKVIETKGDIIGEVMLKKPNPLLKYKETLNPSLWGNFEIVANIFHYVDTVRRGNLVGPEMANIVAKCNKDLENALKLGSKGNYGMVFDLQMTRVKKELLKTMKNPRNNTNLVCEYENLILVMTALREYIGPITSISHDEEEFEIISKGIYHQALFYVNSTNYDEDTKLVTDSIKENMLREVKVVMSVMGLNNLKGEFRQSEIEGAYDLKLHRTVEDVKKKFEGTELHDVLIFEDVNVTEAERLRKAILKDIYAKRVSNNSNVAEMCSSSHYMTYGSAVVETDDLIIKSETLVHCIGVAIIQATLYPTNVYQFFTNLATNIRVSALMGCYDGELKKETAMKIIEVKEDSNSELLAKLDEAEKKIKDLTYQLSNAVKIENENKELESENKRLRDGLTKLSDNNKELNAYRELMHAESNKFFDDEADSDPLSESIEFLKSKEVYLIGGYDKWANRLKEVLPNLKYFDADSQNSGLEHKLKTGEAIVIYNTAVNSHGLSYKLMPVLEKNQDIDLVIINSHPNVNRLIEFVHSRVK